MQYSNIHTHTVFSDGVHSVRENIESAIAKNMLSLGISDHSFTACDTSYCIKKDAYSEYFKTINDLKREYEGKMPVLLGLEQDYFSDIDRDKFDYIIASVHYIIKDNICYPIDHSLVQQQNCINDAFGGNIIDVAKTYFEMVVEHVRNVKPDCVGHFDVLTKFSIFPEDDEEYKRISLEALKETLTYCKYVEVNTGAIARKVKTVPYPSEFLLENLHKLGGEAVLSSDCHNATNLTFDFDNTVKLLKKVGFDHISYLSEKGYIKQSI